MALIKKRYYSVDGRMIGYKDLNGRKDLLTDALGSVTAELDQSCTKVFDGRYKPYGGDLSSSGTRGRYGWNGSWGYRETGLSASSHYVRARYFSKLSGTWTTLDPLWPAQPASVYVSSNVIKSIDPSGLQLMFAIPKWIPLPRVLPPGWEFIINPGGSGPGWITPPIPPLWMPLPRNFPRPDKNPYPDCAGDGETDHETHETECNELHDHYKIFCGEGWRVPQTPLCSPNVDREENLRRWHLHCNCCAGRKEFMAKCPDRTNWPRPGGKPGHMPPMETACENCELCSKMIIGPPFIEPMPRISPPPSPMPPPGYYM